MTNTLTTTSTTSRLFRHGFKGTPLIAVVLGLALGTDATSLSAANNRYCSTTANAQLNACKHEVVDDYYVAQAICTNTADGAKREECREEAEAARKEGNQLCKTQRAARGSLCNALGEDRYDPEFEPVLFDATFANPNPYFPLVNGHQWKYMGGDETVTVKVLDKTKLIEGVTCIVVNDLVEQDGQPIEDTDDWYGQRLNGTVDYCGESVKDFETFEGDNPKEPELVDIAGSWKAGRDGALAGTQMPAVPAVGAVYRQEWAPSNAEDAAEVLSVTFGPGSTPSALHQFVPPGLANALCAAKDCVVTGEFSPIEPGGFQRKYYARGIGLFLEVSPKSGNITQLVECNVDPKCASLPAL